MLHNRHETNSELIDTLKSKNIPRVGDGIIKSKTVERVMELVDRKHFTMINPYDDTSQFIGYNATISPPHIHAHALEFFKERLSKPLMRALDIGCGSGYLSLCMALMGMVVGIDHFDELVKLSTNNVIKAKYEQLLESGDVQFITYDGREGYPFWRPYDVIYVGASVASVPQKLLDQLAKGGAMLIPVGSSYQELTLYERDEDGQIYTTRQFHVRFDPLTTKNAQYPEYNLFI